MKKVLMLMLCGVLLIGCSKTEEEQDEIIQNNTNSIVTYDSDDLDEDYSDEDVQTVSLKGDSISFSGSGATVNGTVITITKAGSYQFEGTLNDGSIIVDTTSDSLVRIILDDANISCSNSAAIYVKQADKVLLTLANGSENTLNDGASYTLADASNNEPNAAVFSKDDLTVNGSGSLSVNANYNNGIQSKDDLKIVNGSITITSIDDALVGKDLLAIRNGTIKLDAGGDGMKTTNEDDLEKGNLAVEGGTISIIAQTDGMQSANELYIYDGNITITSGGGSTNSSKQNVMANGNPWGNWNATTEEDSVSAKGLKSVNYLEVSGGTLTLNSSDDALHTNGTMFVSNGIMNASSGDDGMHADTSLTISGGTIDITESYEGIESSELIFTGGIIHVKASDDGINAGGGNDGSSTNGRPGENNFNADSSKQIIIEDGYLYIDADGDGIDSNGSITMSGGTVIVNGPTDNGNGALDFDGTFQISGGYLIAAGSMGMLQSPTEIINGNCVVIGLNQNGTSLLHLQDDSGTDILTFQPTKSMQSVIFYSSELKENTTYEIYTGGSADGEHADGLYAEAAYSGGTLYDSFTITSSLTSIGNTQSRMGGGPQVNPPGGGMQPGSDKPR